ncbi:MAG: TRAP transporter small permease [Deltaproteobacteria bacterium]|nr:TRAP transporter small permease [Deltaproteobacteria bacterium]
METSLFEKSVAWLSRFLDRTAGWCLVGMMLLTVADVILRLFRRPILGTYEIVGLLGAIVIAFAMPHTTFQRGHVAVQILVSRLPVSSQFVINLITRILSVILFALVAWQCFAYGNELKAAGEVSMTLRLPFYPVLYGIAVASVTVCLVIISGIFKSMAKGVREWYMGRGADRGAREE